MSEQGLRQRFLNAAGWTVFGYALNTLLRLGSNLLLTRLLAPEMFGVMAVGNLVITGLVMFSDVGLAAGAIRSKQGDDPTFLNVTWVLQIARGCIIALTALGVAGLLFLSAEAGLLPSSSAYANPVVPSLIATLSILGVIGGFESTNAILARRNLSQARLVQIELGCQVATTAFILLWASVSPSVWALAFGWIFGATIKTALTHVALPGPSNWFQWDRAAFQEIFHFSKWTALSSSFTFLLSSGDRLLLGAFLSATEMGFYSIAFMLASALQTAVIRLISSAVLPALSEVFRDRPHQLKQTLYRVRMPLDVVCLVSAGGLMVLGQPIVNLLYDARYEPAGWMLGVLALTLVSTPIEVFDQCLVAMGRPKRQSALTAVRLVALYTLIPVGYFAFGIHGAIAAVACSAFVNVFAALTLQARMGLLDWRHEYRAVPLLGAGVAAGWLVRYALGQ